MASQDAGHGRRRLLLRRLVARHRHGARLRHGPARPPRRPRRHRPPPRASCSPTAGIWWCSPRAPGRADGRLGRSGAARPGSPCPPAYRSSRSGFAGAFAAMPRGRGWPVPGRQRVSVRFGAPLRLRPDENAKQLTERVRARGQPALRRGRQAAGGSRSRRPSGRHARRARAGSLATRVGGHRSRASRVPDPGRPLDPTRLIRPLSSSRGAHAAGETVHNLGSAPGITGPSLWDSPGPHLGGNQDLFEIVLAPTLTRMSLLTLSPESAGRVMTC